MRTPVLTVLALVAFAGNSVLCRMALGRGTIDPASFTAIRLLAGAVTLVGIAMALRGKRQAAETRGNWLSAAMLFLYAVAFSFAYVSLGTGTGALILFGAVQCTMILSALFSGERPHPLQWLGFLIAMTGLLYLVFPGLTAPSLLGSLLMAAAGVAWGVYSLLGRNAADPLLDTTHNFVRTLPMVAVVSLLAIAEFDVSAAGISLALLSGAVASGVGYVIWYAALRGLTATKAATVQLTVPVLAAAGGVFFMAETLSLRLLLAGSLTLGGVGLAVAVRQRFS